MRISLIMTTAWPAQGGLQLLALRLAQQLQQRGHEVRILARFTENHALPDYFGVMETARVYTTEGVKVEILSVVGWRRWLLLLVFRLLWRRNTFSLARSLYRLAFQAEMARALKDAEVVHYLGTGTELLGYAAQESARKNGVPFLVEPAVHAGQWGDSFRDWPLYREADGGIAHSEFEAGVLQEGGVESARVKVVRHGFDGLPPGDGEGFRRTHGIEGPMILFVGRRCREKGYFRLLDAFAKLRLVTPEIRLVVIGPGGATPSAAPGVVELGQVTNEVRQDALAAATLFCLPSEGESFGMAYFEAWACGKPVVALDLPVLRETIGASGGGLLAAPDRPDELVEKLCFLIEQPEQAKAMGQSGQGFARGYSWNRAIEDYLEVYARGR